MIPAYFMANISGIPRIESNGVNVTATSVDFTFRSNRWRTNNFNGIVIVRINNAIQSGTTTTLPITFSSGNGQIAITGINAAPITVADIGVGVYLFYYDQDSNTLQKLT